MSRQIRIRIAAGFAALLLAVPAWAAGQNFEAELDPAPFDATTKDNVVGIGNVTATLDGHTLIISGTFSGLSSPATAAELRSGLAMGVPGDAIGELTVAHDTSGAVSGKINLNPKQIAALRAKSVYVRIDSHKAPDGNLRGWLEASGNN